MLKTLGMAGKWPVNGFFRTPSRDVASGFYTVKPVFLTHTGLGSGRFCRSRTGSSCQSQGIFFQGHGADLFSMGVKAC